MCRRHLSHATATRTVMAKILRIIRLPEVFTRKRRGRSIALHNTSALLPPSPSTSPSIQCAAALRWRQMERCWCTDPRMLRINRLETASGNSSSLPSDPDWRSFGTFFRCNKPPWCLFASVLRMGVFRDAPVVSHPTLLLIIHKTLWNYARQPRQCKIPRCEVYTADLRVAMCGST